MNLMSSERENRYALEHHVQTVRRIVRDGDTILSPAVKCDVCSSITHTLSNTRGCTQCVRTRLSIFRDRVDKRILVGVAHECQRRARRILHRQVHRHISLNVIRIELDHEIVTLVHGYQSFGVDSLNVRGASPDSIVSAKSYRDSYTAPTSWNSVTS